MKKNLTLFLILIMLFCMTIPAGIGAITYGVNIFVNGTVVDFSGGYGEPFISDEGRTMVPVRGTAEAYGCKVEWDAPNYQAVVTYGNHYVIIPINKTYIITDTGTVSMDTFARIIEDRTYLPIRYVMEAVGARVDWVATSRTVVINAPDVIDDFPVDPEDPSVLPYEPSGPSDPYVNPVEEPDNDQYLSLLKESLKANGKFDSALGYYHQETTPANSSLVSKLVYNPDQNLVYVLIEMDLDGSSGDSRTSLRLNLNGSGHTVAYYTFNMLNVGTEFSWTGHFEKNRYADDGGYGIDSTNSAAKDINNSLVLNNLAVYQSGLAIQAVDNYCRSFLSRITSATLGFSS